MTSEVVKRGLANKKNKFKNLSEKSETQKVRDDFKSGLNDYLSGKKITQTIVGETKAPETVSELLKKASSEYEKKLNGDSEETVNANEQKDNLEENKNKTEQENDKVKISSTGELINKLKEVEENYSSKSDEDYYADKIEEVKPTLGLEPKQVENKTEEDFLAESYAEVKSDYEKDVKRQNEKTNSKLESLNEDVSDLVKELLSDNEESFNYYDKQKEAVNNENLRRGLARSSVAVLSLDGLEKEEKNNLSSMISSFNGVIDDYEKEIADLKIELDEALSEMDIELAVEINELVNKKSAEFEKEKEKIIEYNEKILELEKEYQDKLPSLYKQQEKQKEKLAEEYKGINKKTMQEEMFNIALDYYSGIDKEVALQELSNNNELAKLLGQRIYDVYYKILKS